MIICDDIKKEIIQFLTIPHLANLGRINQEWTDLCMPLLKRKIERLKATAPGDEKDYVQSQVSLLILKIQEASFFALPTEAMDYLKQIIQSRATKEHVEYFESFPNWNLPPEQSQYIEYLREVSVLAILKCEWFFDQDSLSKKEWKRFQQDLESAERSLIVRWKLYRIMHHFQEGFDVIQAIQSLYNIRLIFTKEYSKIASQVRQRRYYVREMEQIWRDFLKDVGNNPTSIETDANFAIPTETSRTSSNLLMSFTKALIGILYQMVHIGFSLWLAPNILFLFCLNLTESNAIAFLLLAGFEYPISEYNALRILHLMFMLSLWFWSDAFWFDSLSLNALGIINILFVLLALPPAPKYLKLELFFDFLYVLVKTLG